MNLHCDLKLRLAASLSDTVTVTVTGTVKPPFTFTIASEFEFDRLAAASQAGSRPSSRTVALPSWQPAEARPGRARP